MSADVTRKFVGGGGRATFCACETDTHVSGLGCPPPSIRRRCVTLVCAIFTTFRTRSYWKSALCGCSSDMKDRNISHQKVTVHICIFGQKRNSFSEEPKRTTGTSGSEQLMINKSHATADEENQLKGSNSIQARRLSSSVLPQRLVPH
ncbi:hypothetical protein AVEN_32246-1 [Araneus ventricosus]|uniref:Uncharacterized protein n=1 Tax=Araneus ventricosus TaxID=182803 RepID=A0A4Y2V8F9_ARAVE|nr:hypothetical protein AVEN_32246-1 [Araneus ventricosus]